MGKKGSGKHRSRPQPPPNAPTGPKIWRETQAAAQLAKSQRAQEQPESQAEVAKRVSDKRREEKTQRRRKVGQAFNVSFSKIGDHDLAALMATLDANDDGAGCAIGGVTRRILQSGGYSRVRARGEKLPFERPKWINKLPDLPTKEREGGLAQEEGKEIAPGEPKQMPLPDGEDTFTMDLPVCSKKGEKAIARSPVE